MAACGNASTRFRAFRADDPGDPWPTLLDVTVGSGGWYYYWMSASSFSERTSAIVLTPTRAAATGTRGTSRIGEPGR
jgi:hypothetical protein